MSFDQLVADMVQADLVAIPEEQERLNKEWDKVKDMIDVPEQYAHPKTSGLTCSGPRKLDSRLSY